LFIWAIVFYKIFFVSSDEPVLPAFSIPEPECADTVSEDSFVIVANYRDPFLGSIWRGASPKKKPVATPIEKKPEPQKKHQWPQMSFLGVVEGKSGNLGLFTIAGKQHIVKSGAVVDGYTVSAFTADSITILYENEKKTLHK